MTAADPRVVEVVVPILRAWGLQSHHGEWSDTETRERAARNIATALAEAGIGDVAEAERRGAQAVVDAVMSAHSAEEAALAARAAAKFRS